MPEWFWDSKGIREAGSSSFILSKWFSPVSCSCWEYVGTGTGGADFWTGFESEGGKRRHSFAVGIRPCGYSTRDDMEWWSGLQADELLASVKPFTCSSPATERKEVSSSWATFTSPRYMKSRTETSWAFFTPFRYNRGCSWMILCNTLLKKEEQAERITLCAWSCPSSKARVTSKKLSSPRRSRKAVLIWDSKSFHWIQNFSLETILSNNFFLRLAFPFLSSVVQLRTCWESLSKSVVFNSHLHFPIVDTFLFWYYHCHLMI